MRRSPAQFSESEASNHTPSLADFTTTTPAFKFSVHTAGPQNRSRIRLSEPDEVRYWTEEFGVTGAELRDAIKKVGNSAKAVEQALGLMASKGYSLGRSGVGK